MISISYKRANDRLTDVSLSAPDSVCYFGESSQQIWQTLASGLTQRRENVFMMRPEAEPAGLVIKLKTFLSKEKQHLSYGGTHYRLIPDWDGERVCRKL